MDICEMVSVSRDANGTDFEESSYFTPSICDVQYLLFTLYFQVQYNRCLEPKMPCWFDMDGALASLRWELIHGIVFHVMHLSVALSWCSCTARAQFNPFGRFGDVSRYHAVSMAITRKTVPDFPAISKCFLQCSHANNDLQTSTTTSIF